MYRSRHYTTSNHRKAFMSGSLEVSPPKSKELLRAHSH